MKDKKNTKKEKQCGHTCPHCGMVFFLINDYFNHVELFHPNKNAI